MKEISHQMSTKGTSRVITRTSVMPALEKRTQQPCGIEVCTEGSLLLLLMCLATCVWNADFPAAPSDPPMKISPGEQLLESGGCSKERKGVRWFHVHLPQAQLS
ncbi:UNVERIFIED_CONTAM: hypothetical protein K2H54_032345 [Gekko kuhli]